MLDSPRSEVAATTSLLFLSAFETIYKHQINARYEAAAWGGSARRRPGFQAPLRRGTPAARCPKRRACATSVALPRDRGTELWLSTVGCRKGGCLSAPARHTVSWFAGSASQSSARAAVAWPRGPTWRQSTTSVVPPVQAAVEPQAKNGDRIVRYRHHLDTALRDDLDRRGDLLQRSRHASFERADGTGRARRASRLEQSNPPTNNVPPLGLGDGSLRIPPGDRAASLHPGWGQALWHGAVW